MKTINEVITSINIKIKEHSDIIKEIDEEIQSFKGSKAGWQVKGQMEDAAKRLVLKDKMLFHKTAVLVLNDLKATING